MRTSSFSPWINIFSPKNKPRSLNDLRGLNFGLVRPNVVVEPYNYNDLGFLTPSNRPLFLKENQNSAFSPFCDGEASA